MCELCRQRWPALSLEDSLILTETRRRLFQPLEDPFGGALKPPAMTLLDTLAVIGDAIEFDEVDSKEPHGFTRHAVFEAAEPLLKAAYGESWRLATLEPKTPEERQRVYWSFFEESYDASAITLAPG